MSTTVSLLAAAISIAACLTYASVGEIISESCGILNLGLEGVMLLGAVSSALVVQKTGSLTMALLVAIVVGLAVGLVFAFLTVTLRANQVVCGLALVTFGTGFSGFIGKSICGTPLVCHFNKIPIPILSDIPVIGDIFFKQDVMVYILYILVPVVAVFLYRTGPGLRLRALGENPGALDAAGVPVTKLRYLYVMIANAIVSMGGAYVTLAYVYSWKDDITSGKGWIAAALVIFSFWNPLLAALGSIFFGYITALGVQVQSTGVSVSAFFIQMLPYLCTVLALILSAIGFGKRLNAAPKALGSAYDREAR